MPETVRRITVPLIQTASDALDEACSLSAHSTTDTINRALQLYAFVLRHYAKGDRLVLRNAEGEAAWIKVVDVDGISG